jgi:hypothetical protein
MAEIQSRQAVKVVGGTKNLNADSGRVRTVVLETPAAYAALQIGDTVAGGVYIPAGCRVLGARVSNNANAASVTISIGLRKKKDGTVLNAGAIASGIAITAATTNPTAASNGTYLAAGAAAQVLTDDAEVYLTTAGAISTLNVAIRVEVDFVGA